MARNADDGTTRYFELYERGINLIFIKERHIDTESYKQALESAGIQIESDGTAEGELVSDISKAITKFMKAKAMICMIGQKKVLKQHGEMEK